VLLFLPFLLLRLLFKAAVALFVLPFVLIAVMIGLAVGLVAMFLPLLPLAFLVFCVWAIVRLASRPAFAR